MLCREIGRGSRDIVDGGLPGCRAISLAPTLPRAATGGGRLDCRAPVTQWHDHREAAPDPAVQAHANDRLPKQVQDIHHSGSVEHALRRSRLLSRTRIENSSPTTRTAANRPAAEQGREPARPAPGTGGIRRRGRGPAPAPRAAIRADVVLDGHQCDRHLDYRVLRPRGHRAATGPTGPLMTTAGTNLAQPPRQRQLLRHPHDGHWRRAGQTRCRRLPAAAATRPGLTSGCAAHGGRIVRSCWARLRGSGPCPHAGERGEAGCGRLQVGRRMACTALS